MSGVSKTKYNEERFLLGTSQNVSLEGGGGFLGGNRMVHRDNGREDQSSPAQYRGGLSKLTANKGDQKNITELYGRIPIPLPPHPPFPPPPPPPNFQAINDDW